MLDTLDVLCDLNPEYEAIIESVPKLMNVDFSGLLEPRYDYADQPEIKKSVCVSWQLALSIMIWTSG